MKSAKEWVASMDKCFDRWVTRTVIDHSPSEMEKLIAAIQADAQAHGEAIGRVKGLREAAEAIWNVRTDGYAGSLKAHAGVLELARRLEAELTRDINNSPSQPTGVDLK